MKDADPADQAAIEYEKEMVLHRAAVARNMVKTLAQALERVEKGTYGQCFGCGAAIEKKRLEAIPWAHYCVICQEAREQG
jgi:DnaK suppressor protein